jgi:tRNA A-37 threonylcarbamoyl transferase component Bud32
MTYLALGTRIQDRYELLREIGRGGHSVVYEAQDHKLDMRVALKMIVPPPAVAHIARERIRREVLAVRTLTHPHIVQVFDLLEEDPWNFIVMELVYGADLQETVKKQGPLSVEFAAQIGQDIAQALALAHRRGVLHRDVKPLNILVGKDRLARLADFGSARVEGQITMTQLGSFVGTLDYTAPEVLVGKRADARSDIFALGMTLYFILTGKFPDRPSPNFPPTPAPQGHHPRSERPEIPDWLDGIVAQATRSDPSMRFPTAHSMAEALKQRTLNSSKKSFSKTQVCLVCGAPDPLSLSVCSSCRSATTEAVNTLVVLYPPAGPEARQVLEDTIVELFQVPVEELQEVLEGARPLLLVSASSASAIVAQLATHKVSARTLPIKQAWRLVPVHFYGFLAGMIGFGCLVGLLALPLLLWTSMVLGSVLFFWAYQSARKPLIKLQASPTSDLSPKVKTKVVKVLSLLPSGTARSLLSDVVYLGLDLRRTFAQTKSIPSDVERYTTELLTAACNSALVLERLDRTLARLEIQRLEFSELPPEWLESSNKCEQTRDCLVQRLLETVAMLGIAQSQAVFAPQGVGRQLAEINTELRRELHIQAQVTREYEKLFNQLPLKS